MRSHGWYDLPPFAYVPERSELAVADALFRARRGALVAESDSHDAADLTRIARRVFSLEVDLSSFAGLLGEEPDLARALARGGGRMLRAATIFEDAVKVLLTTNCSWAATRGMVMRLIEATGGGAFPGPEALARLSARALREKVRCGYRAEAVARFARRTADGTIDLACWEDPRVPSEEVRAQVLAEHGFGPYAAEGLLRILGRHEYLAIDSWIRQQYRRLHPGPKKSTDRSIARRYARYGRFRGLALWLEMTRHWHEGEEPERL